MEKTTIKKLVGGLLVVMIIATIGTVIVSAQTDESTETDEQTKTFLGHHPLMNGPKPFFYNLTEDQQAEIDTLRDELIEQGATCEEIRDAIMEKLDEYGVLDEQLENEIANTEQRLNMLERKKELRSEGKSWEEIDEIIQEEFDLEFPDIEGQGMMFRRGFRNGNCPGPRDFTSSEQSDL